MSSGGVVPRNLAVVCYTMASVVVLLLAVGIVTDSTSIWVGLSSLGEELAYIGLTLILIYLVNPELGYMVLVAVLFSGSVNIFLKYLFNIPRPPPEFWRAPASGPGLPSGHTQVSATFWSAVSAASRVRCVYVVSVAVVASVAASRLGLRVHSVHDVVAGMAVGFFAGLVSVVLMRYLGLGKAVFLLSLINAALSYRNIMLDYEVSASTSLLGLGFSMAVSAPILKKSVKTLSHSSQAVRLALLTVVLSTSFLTAFSARLMPLAARVFTYFALGLLISAAPTIFIFLSRLLAKPGRAYL